MNRLVSAFQKKNEGRLTPGRFWLAVVLMILVLLMAGFYFVTINPLAGVFILLLDALIFRMIWERMPEEYQRG